MDGALGVFAYVELCFGIALSDPMAWVLTMTVTFLEALAGASVAAVEF
mgnify:CR=1 FL=1